MEWDFSGHRGTEATCWGQGHLLLPASQGCLGKFRRLKDEVAECSQVHALSKISDLNVPLNKAHGILQALK